MKADGATTTLNGAGDAALLKVFAYLAKRCPTRAIFDQKCRPIMKAIAYHESSDEMKTLLREARHIYAAVHANSNG